jgi:glycosyltransferase involved in cell wall biosynthesis
VSRILFWCDAFWPNIGGVQVLGARLVTALRDRGHQILVVTRRDELELAAESSFEGVPVRRFDFLQVAESRDALRWFELRRTVAQLKRGFAPEVVHVYHATFDTVLHLETRDAHPAATLCTVHGAFPDHVLTPNSVLRRLLRDAEWVTACSAATLERIRRQAPEIADHCSVILNGLEATAHAPTPPPLEAPRLLCVGRLATKEKGFDLALSALARIAPRYPQLRLTIAGDGEERARLERQAHALGIGDRVDFLGWVNPAQIPAAIAQSTMVLMPSRVEEGFGLAVLQAGQLERPVIAARVGGLPEVVVDGETGLLIEPEDTGALARAIARLLDDPRCAAAMGRAARQRALAAFGWEQHVDAYDELIRGLAERGRVRRSLA